MALATGTRGDTRAIVAAQMLAQMGAWLVGIFFAAYVVMVPLLVALTDRISG